MESSRRYRAYPHALIARLRGGAGPGLNLQASQKNHRSPPPRSPELDDQLKVAPPIYVLSPARRRVGPPSQTG